MRIFFAKSRSAISHYHHNLIHLSGPLMQKSTPADKYCLVGVFFSSKATRKMTRHPDDFLFLRKCLTKQCINIGCQDDVFFGEVFFPNLSYYKQHLFWWVHFGKSGCSLNKWWDFSIPPRRAWNPIWETTIPYTDWNKSTASLAEKKAKKSKAIGSMNSTSTYHLPTFSEFVW